MELKLNIKVVTEETADSGNFETPHMPPEERSEGRLTDINEENGWRDEKWHHKILH